MLIVSSVPFSTHVYHVFLTDVLSVRTLHRSCLSQDLALDAVNTVAVELGGGVKEIDIKNYAKVEKLPGGTIEDCKVLAGVMFNKDVVVPGRMRRKISNPRILLLDCPLEYKKGESQTNVELTREEDW